MYHEPIPQSELVKGIRFRVGNIQVGESDIVASEFPETRFNSWSIGELHVLSNKECNPPSAHDEIIMRPYSKRRNDHWLPLVGINEAFLAGYETQ